MSVLEIIETALECELGDVQAIEDLRQRPSLDWLERLWRALRPLSDLSDDQRLNYVPERRGIELQPYFPHRISGDRRFVGDLPAYEGVGSRVHIPRASALIARHLLYCNRIVIDDPTWWFVCDNIGTWADGQFILEGNDYDKLSSRKDSVLHWLELLQHLRPLLADQRIILIPPEFGPQAWQSGNTLRDFPVPANLADTKIVDELYKELVELCSMYGYDASFFNNMDLANPTHRELLARGWYKSSIDDMGIQLQTSLKYQKRLDLSPVLSFDALALNAILKQGELHGPNDFSKSTGYARMIGTLIRLPVLLDLGDDPSLLVGLAKDEQGFADWRAGMGRALETIAAFDPTQPGFEGSVRVAFENALYDAVVRLQREKDKASWRRAFRSTISEIGVTAVGAGAAGGVAALSGLSVAAAVGPFGLLGAGLGYAAWAIWTYCHGGAARQQGTAAKVLYDILRG